MLTKDKAHSGDPCIYCGVSHDDVPPGPCVGRLNDRIAYRRSLGLPDLGLDEKIECSRCGELIDPRLEQDGCRDLECPSRNDEWEQKQMKATAEVSADHQHGPVVTVCVGEVRVSVYLYGETGVVTTPEGQHGIEVTGPWHAVRDQLTYMAVEREKLRDEADRLREAVATLMYVGNLVVRGEYTAEEWHDAVKRVTPEHAKPTVCKRENDDDLSGA